MKKLLFTFIFLISINVFPQFNSDSTILIVHGAWGGGWSFKKVDELLTNKGANVYRPTLSGLGEKTHLLSKDINLKTHINDIINVILYEELSEIILVGHSYGGMVITGVADSIPQRIRKLVYLDAIVPVNNESVSSIFGFTPTENDIKTGGIVPAWVDKNKLPPKDVPQPINTMTDKIILTNKEKDKIPSFYIHTVEKNKKPEEDDFASQAEKAKLKGWEVIYFESDHNPQWSAPEKISNLIMLLSENKE